MLEQAHVVWDRRISWNEITLHLAILYGQDERQFAEDLYPELVIRKYVLRSHDYDLPEQG